MVENAQSIAEVGLDGKLIAVHPLGLVAGRVHRPSAGRPRRPTENATWPLSSGCNSGATCSMKSGKSFAIILTDALQHPHSGITDVELGDLAGDGGTKLLVSYAGVVGVQEASLDGHRLWSNRQVYNVSRLAIAPAEPKRAPRPVLRRRHQHHSRAGCPRRVLQDLSPPGIGPLRSILIAELRLGGGTERPMPWCCGISARGLTENLAVGFALDGSGAAWGYSLPAGFQPQPIEPIIAGQITLARSASEGGREARGAWLLPGPDGSIHILTPDGRLVDRFNYGAPLQGLATVEIGGRPALVVATAGGLEALRVG